LSVHNKFRLWTLIFIFSKIKFIDLPKELCYNISKQ